MEQQVCDTFKEGDYKVVLQIPVLWIHKYFYFLGPNPRIPNPEFRIQIQKANKILGRPNPYPVTTRKFYGR
jgi:hypothetical protein